MKLIPTYIAVCLATALMAQYPTVSLNYEKSYFGEGEPLPAEKEFMVSGPIPTGVVQVDIGIYRANGQFDKLLYANTWKQSFDGSSTTFYLPVSYRLRSGKQYDIRVSYYFTPSRAERERVQTRIGEQLSNYLYQMTELHGGRVKFSESPQKLTDQLESIVENGLSGYRDFLNTPFPGFSVVVRNGLDQLHRNKHKRMVGTQSVQDTSDMDKEGKTGMAVDQLLGLMQGEIVQYLERETRVVKDVKDIILYPTEKIPNVLSVNLGYSATYFDGGPDALRYGTAPFAGLSFPLGKKAFASPIISNLSVSLGIMLTDMELNDVTYTGPFIQRPIYAGFGYRFLDFMRFTAGAVLLEEQGSSGSTFSIGEWRVSPFIGLAIEVNLWMGFGKQLR